LFQSFTMKLSEVSKLTENIKNQENILQLIDIKIESDMEKVIAEIKNQNTEIKRLEDNFNTKFTMLMWVLGILMALMVALKFFV